MPVAVITVSVRGWGKTEQDARARALSRLSQFNSDQQAGMITNDRGVDFRVLDPGNGGPCAPERVPFEFLIAAEDLPEFKPRDDDDDQNF